MEEIKQLNIKDKFGSIHEYEIVDEFTRSKINDAKNVLFNENQFKLIEDNVEVMVSIKSDKETEKNKYLRGDGNWTEILPPLPSTGTFTLKCIDGNLQWIEETS